MMVTAPAPDSIVAVLCSPRPKSRHFAAQTVDQGPISYFGRRSGLLHRSRIPRSPGCKNEAYLHGSKVAAVDSVVHHSRR